MERGFSEVYYKVQQVVADDPNTDTLDTETIHQIDQILNPVGDEDRHNLLDYIFWRFAYELNCWRLTSDNTPHPNGELLEKWGFYTNLKRVG